MLRSAPIIIPENSIPLKSKFLAASDKPASSPVSSHIPVKFIKFPNIIAKIPETNIPLAVPIIAANDFLLNPDIIINDIITVIIESIDVSNKGFFPAIIPRD